MKYFLFVLISILFFLPSISSDAADSHHRYNREGLDRDHNLRGRENGEENENTRKPNFSGTSSTATATDDTGGKQRERRTIIGGTAVGGDRYSFFVELGLQCGATLIAENIVFTAGHCLGFSDWSPDAWVGTLSGRDGDYRRLNGISIHPRFYDTASTYDFALLTLNEPILDGITPVQLNRNDNSPSGGDILTAIGLGETGNRLEEVDVPFFSFNQCERIYTAEGLPLSEPAMFCAGGGGGRDTCDGDSGGPILDSDGVQVGITSFGLECGQQGVPAVYARVSTAIDWIDEFICMNALSVDRMPSNCGFRCPVQIEIDYGGYPEDVSWNLASLDENRNLIFVPPDATLPEFTQTRTVYLPAGRYYFQIDDAFGDGIGGGSYRIRLGCEDTVIERSSAFGASDAVEFAVTAPTPTELPTSSPPGLNRIRVDIIYDNFPEQTAWTLVNGETTDVIYRSRYGSVTSPGLVSEYLEVPDGNYWLFVVDSARDGITSSNGSDVISISRVSNGGDIQIASYGAFQYLADINFTLP